MTKDAEAALVKPLPQAVDKGVSRIMVAVEPDQDGNESLFFRVVLRDHDALAAPSQKVGQRLQRIAMELRRRAATQVPGFAYVSFLAESDLRRPKRKTA